ERARRSSQLVLDARRRWLPLGWALDLANDAIAVGAIALAWAAARHFMELERDHRALLERKAGELEAFAGRVAHDILSPLTRVGVAVDVAEHHLAPPEDCLTRNLLQRARSSLHRIQRLVADLLEFARSGAEPKPGTRTSLNDVLRDVTEAFMPEAE